MPVESTSPDHERPRGGTWIRLLGPLNLGRDGVALELPSSRKVRALLAYLALARKPVRRTQLCDLFWDVPNDPRGELRWCLSKLRRLLDEPSRRRVEASDDSVALDLDDCRVDTIEVARAVEHGIERLGTERLLALSSLFVGDFLAGLDIDCSIAFDNWLLTGGSLHHGLCAMASRFLSPFDPLLFGMLGSRAKALFRLGEYEEAAD